MTPKDLAAEAAWEYERLTADGRMHDHGLLTRIIQAAIEKAVGAVKVELIEWCKRQVPSGASLAVCECGHYVIDHRREKDHDECEGGECECIQIRPRAAQASEQGLGGGSCMKGAEVPTDCVFEPPTQYRRATVDDLSADPNEVLTIAVVPIHASEQGVDTKRLDWLEAHRGEFCPPARLGRSLSWRKAIDAAMSQE